MTVISDHGRWFSPPPDTDRDHRWLAHLEELQERRVAAAERVKAELDLVIARKQLEIDTMKAQLEDTQ